MSATPSYSFKKLPFMAPQGPHMPISDAYVTIPPALTIRDDEGALWTLGFDQGGWRTGEYEFDVVRCGPKSGDRPMKTGEFACRIEFRAGKVRIFGTAGWRTWNGHTFI